ncbi:MAG: caa(3)-type oxidase subunit IV [Myxococcota bacterium]|nr:caa(3)-type oxidase subunit IV [Myxococcota bacterium]
MSEAHAEAHAEEHDHAHGHDINYFKVYITLLVLLVISVVGPMFEIQALTLITAFGIACVKAYLVAKNFMHINLAQRYVTYLVATCLVFMLLFFAGVAPDVMKPEGTNWVKPGWVEVPIEEDLGIGGHGSAGH